MARDRFRSAALLAGATLALCGLALARPGEARADFAVFPSLVDVRVEPGGVASGVFNVRLAGERGERFRVLRQDAVQQSDGVFRYEPPSGSPFSASTWVGIAPRVFAGTPDRVQLLEYRVRVPENAEPGDHITSITIKRLPASSGNVGVVQAISIRLTVRVAGPVHRSVAISSVSAPRFAGGGPVVVSVNVRNTGNVRLDFDRGNRGALRILDDAAEKARLDFRGPLYPGQTRSFRLAWQDPPLLGRFRTIASVATPGGPVSRSSSFWVVPWRQAGAFVLVVLAVVVLLAGRLRRGRRLERAAADDG